MTRDELNDPLGTAAVTIANHLTENVTSMSANVARDYAEAAALLAYAAKGTAPVKITNG